MSVIRIYFFILLFLSSSIATAGVITHAGYSYDDSYNIVAGGGLEWLQWTETLGETRESALTLYSGEGWRLATSDELVNLIESFFGKSYYIAPAGWRDYGWEGFETVSDASYFNFVNMFGDTFVSEGGGITRESMGLGEEGGQFDLAYVLDSTSESPGPWSTRAILDPATLGVDGGISWVGIALVRDVPEPSTFILLGLGLAGLGFKRRRRLH